MKKAPKVKYGIEIVKPWSKEMYNHNDKVADEVRDVVEKRWKDAYKTAEAEYDAENEDEDFHNELETAAYWRLNEIAEDLELELTCQFIGLK